MARTTYKYRETASQTETIMFMIVACLLLASLAALVFRNQIPHKFSSKSTLAPDTIEQLQD